MSAQTALQAALVAGLLVVAAVHTKSRLAGAMAASTWCVGALLFGALAFQERDALVFLGIAAPSWLFFGFMTGLLLFNVLVIARALRRRRSTTRPSTGPSTGPSPSGS